MTCKVIQEQTQRAAKAQLHPAFRPQEGAAAEDFLKSPSQVKIGMGQKWLWIPLTAPEAGGDSSSGGGRGSAADHRGARRSFCECVERSFTGFRDLNQSPAADHSVWPLVLGVGEAGCSHPCRASHCSCIAKSCLCPQCHLLHLSSVCYCQTC